MIRLMFVDNSRPLSESTVRFPDDAVGEYQTDEDGRIRLDLEPGDHRVEIETADGWVERDFTLEDASGLVVVDLRDSSPELKSTRGYFDTGTQRNLGDRYEFRGELGRGGMGVVVRARDTLLNRDVAIKILTPELQGNSEAERIFLTEARSMAKLSHSNLVAVHDVISEDGNSMMVVEFVTGRNLEEVIDEKGMLSQTAVINVGIQVCRVIDYLHSEGVIHRDLKPANLMIEGDGTVKLIDFGLARSLEEIANRGTKIRGTPAYMAPEQVLGLELSESTDIYQIGVTLFEALTGHLPFKKGDVAYQHVHESPPSVEEVGQNIFPALAELVHACMAKTPEERPASARALMEELQAIKQVVTTGRISAVELSDPGDLSQSDEDAADDAAETGVPEKVDDAPDVDAPAAPGPTRWIIPVLAAVALVVGAAYFFGTSLLGDDHSESSGEEGGQARAVDPQPEEPLAEQRIERARAVSTAGQVIHGANSAARTVVEVVPTSKDTSEPSSEEQTPRGSSDGDEARRIDEGGRAASTGAEESRPTGARSADEASSARKPGGGQEKPATADRAAKTDEAADDQQAEAASSGDDETGEIASTESSKSSGAPSDGEDDGTDPASNQAESDPVEIPELGTTEKFEAETGSDTSSEAGTETEGGTDSADDESVEADAPSDDSTPSKQADSRDEEPDEEEADKKREQRSAPVSF